MLLLDLTTLLTVALLLFVVWPDQTNPVARRSGHWIGRLIALLLLSPGLRYFSTLFTFPIRLQLSAWAGDLLRLAGMDVQTEGNVLVREGVDMAVDPACMGLQMTGVSLLAALFFVIWQEKQDQKRLPFGWVMAYGLAAFGFTIVCNLFRIMLLVLFGAMPDTWSHEVVGLVCVGVYSWLPSWALARWLVHEFGMPAEDITKKTSTVALVKRSILSVSGGAGLLALGLVIRAYAAHIDKPAGNLCDQLALQKYGIPTSSAYSCKPLSNGFLQFTKPGILIYIKPQPDWFSADHSPLTCWRGSGYELRQIRETELNGHLVYVGELRKKGQTLYTAWWFSNGNTTTISQLTMRGQLIRGETGFALVNITTGNKALLMAALCPHRVEKR